MRCMSKIELIRQNLHRNQYKSHASTQITLDDDFIVPDAMDDMEQIIVNSGDVILDSVRNQEERVMIRGKLAFQVLYRNPEGGLQTLAGNIAIEEPVNVPGLEEKDEAGVSWELEDLSTEMINSRKLSVKAILTFQVRTEALVDGEAVVEARETENGKMESQEDSPLQVRKRTMDTAALKARRKDTARVRETITLPGNKPAMEQIIWKEMSLSLPSAKPQDGSLLAEGQIHVFCLYEGEGEEMPIQWFEETVPFSSVVELDQSSEGMPSFTRMRLVHKDLEIKPDADGELRELELDAVVELDMKLYAEEPLELVEDLYATDREINVIREETKFDKILTNTTGKCKVTDRMKYDSSDRILQICHNDGQIKIDQTEVKEDGLEISGVLEVTFLYMTSDDKEPIRSGSDVIPFQYFIEVPGVDKESVWQLASELEQLSSVMAGNDTIEVRAVLNLELLALQPVRCPVITEIQEKPLDMESLKALPGITGYIMKKGDRLWDVAKRFHTTVDHVMEMNELDQEEVKEGQRLLLVKELR